MYFTHLSKHKLKLALKNKELGTFFKPRKCLWLSCGNQWEKWTAENMPNLKKKYKYKYKITINLSKIIVLNTWSDITKFHKKFSTSNWDIDWDKVRKETGKDGLLLKLNIDKTKAMKNNILWPTTFDICSTGIWNIDCINDITLLK
jgi:hypothetical protein